MPIHTPTNRRFVLENTYADIDTAQIISRGNTTRGLFSLSITDSSSVTIPRRWEILVEGGFTYNGDDSKYFILDQGRTNISSVTATVLGYEYNVVDVFGDTYHLIFNGSFNFNPTIQRTAGAVLTEPIFLKVLLFAFSTDL